MTAERSQRVVSENQIHIRSHQTNPTPPLTADGRRLDSDYKHSSYHHPKYKSINPKPYAQKKGLHLGALLIFCFTNS